MKFEDASQAAVRPRSIIELNFKKMPILDAVFAAMFKRERDATTPKYKMPIPAGATFEITDKKFTIRITREGVDSYMVIYPSEHCLEMLLTKLGYTMTKDPVGYPATQHPRRLYTLNATYAVAIVKCGRSVEAIIVNPSTKTPTSKGYDVTINVGMTLPIQNNTLVDVKRK